MDASPARFPRRGGRPIRTATASRQIASAIRRDIAAGHWKPGSILPSQAQLARRFETTLDTVRVAVGLLKREGCLGTTPKRRLAVRGLSHGFGERGTLLVAFPFPLHHALANPNMQEMKRGLETAAGKAGFTLLTVHGYRLRQWLPSAYLDWPLCGVILCGLVRKALLREYEKLAPPVILLDCPSSLDRLGSSSVANAAAAKELTERLLAGGHRKVAFLRRFSFATRDVDPDSRERQAGYERAMRKAGIKKPAVITVFPAESAQSPTIRDVVGGRSGFTAFIAADVSIANLLRTAAQSAGRRVPEDLSIVCFQGSKPAPRFSGMAIDFFELGQQAVALTQAAANTTRKALVSPQWTDAQTFRPLR